MKKVTMFGGKGGVGKSTCAGTTALHLAKGGQKTLIISTDPTPSLGHLFAVLVGDKPLRVKRNLYLVEMGLNEIKGMWEESFGQEVYEVFSSFVDIGYQEFVDFITTILPGLKEEFMVDYVRRLAKGEEYQQIIWDTAPLGQTLQLLKMPSIVFEHLKAAPRIYSRFILGKDSRRSLLKIIEDWKDLSATNISFLKEEVEFVMVTIPEALAVQQLAGIFQELEKNQLSPTSLIINQVVKEEGVVFLQQKRRQQQGYIKSLYREYGDLTIKEIPAFPQEVKGLEMLERVLEILFP